MQMHLANEFITIPRSIKAERHKTFSLLENGNLGGEENKSLPTDHDFENQ